MGENDVMFSFYSLITRVAWSKKEALERVL